jgi:hypothetical protein
MGANVSPSIIRQPIIILVLRLTLSVKPGHRVYTAVSSPISTSVPLPTRLTNFPGFYTFSGRLSSTLWPRKRPRVRGLGSPRRADDPVVLVSNPTRSAQAFPFEPSEHKAFALGGTDIRD